jgi:hypothetical protein
MRRGLKTGRTETSLGASSIPPSRSKAGMAYSRHLAALSAGTGCLLHHELHAVGGHPERKNRRTVTKGGARSSSSARQGTRRQEKRRPLGSSQAAISDPPPVRPRSTCPGRPQTSKCAAIPRSRVRRPRVERPSTPISSARSPTAPARRALRWPGPSTARMARSARPGPSLAPPPTRSASPGSTSTPRPGSSTSGPGSMTRARGGS